MSLTLSWINHDINFSSYPEIDGKYDITLVNEKNEHLETFLGKFQLTKIGHVIKIHLIQKNGQRTMFKQINVKKTQIKILKSKESLSTLIKRFLLRQCPDLQKVFNIENFMSDNTIQEKINRKKSSKKNCNITNVITNFDIMERFIGRNFPVKGYVQSGKSNFMISTSTWFLLNNKSSLIVLRNSTDDSEQLKYRIKSFSQQLYSILEENGFDRNLFKVEFVDENKITTDNLSCDEPKILIAIYNKSALGKINEKIGEKQKGKFVLFVDEADLLHKSLTDNEHEDDSGALELEKLINNCFCSFSVSGTILDALLKNNIKVEDLIVLDRPAGYKSHNNFFVRHLTEECKFSTKIDDDIIKNDKNFIPFIEKFMTLESFPTFYKHNHPNYCLLRVSKTVQPMIRLFDTLTNDFRTLTKMLYVGTFTKLHHQNLENIPSITLSNGKTSINKDGIHIFPKGGTPSFILEWLKNNGGVDIFSHIVTLAGDLASRGISFGSADWNKCSKENTLPWHLTSMYATFAKSTDLPELLQITGRLCIVSNDGIPLTLYITDNDHTNLIKGFNLTEEFINRAKNQDKDISLHEYIRNLSIFKKKVPNRSLTKFESFHPKKVNTLSEDNGWMTDINGNYILKDVKVNRYDIEETDKSPIINNGCLLYGQEIKKEEEHVEQQVREEIQSNKEIEQEEYNRLISLFSKWSNGNSKISNFMKGLDPFKIYTRNELKKYALSVGIKEIFHLTKNIVGKTNGYGMIIKKNSDDTFQLYPELISEFKKYF